MKLTLDYTQRLNLHALMGAQRANVDELRMYWRLQDMIDLDAKEKEAIGYKTLQVNGQVQVQWDVGKVLPVKDYDFPENEFQKLSKMVHDWQPGFMIGADRPWVEPLLAQLDAAPVNGAVKETGLGAARGR